MPVVDDEQLSSLLAEGRISALSIDTSIFDQKRLQLNSAAMQAIAGRKERPIDFVLSGTVAQEVLVHLEKAASEAFHAAKKAIGKALFAFETEKPERDDLLELISGGRSAAETSKQRWDQFIEDTGCEVLDDTALVDTATVYNAYFAGEPPFGSGRKKDEFPDALALNALERIAADRGIGILVVSKDGDWKAYCEKSTRLYLVPEIERALALIANAPLGVRKAIFNWISAGSDDLVMFHQEIAYDTGKIEFDVNAQSMHGSVEISTWDTEFKKLEWPGEEEIDVIEWSDTNENEAQRVVASLPVNISVRVPVELDFSIWDNVDKESFGMGGRMIEVDEEITVRATVTLDVHHLGSDDEEIEFVESELEDTYHNVELGEVPMFESEDYWEDVEAE